MRTQTRFHKRVGGAVMIAVMALAIGVPALAGDDDRPRDRSVDRAWPSGESGRPDRDDEDATSRPPVFEPLGVEWTF